MLVPGNVTLRFYFQIYFHGLYRPEIAKSLGHWLDIDLRRECRIDVYLICSEMCSWDFIKKHSTLDQARCHQATSHYLIKYWTRHMIQKAIWPQRFWSTFAHGKKFWMILFISIEKNHLGQILKQLLCYCWTFCNSSLWDVFMETSVNTLRSRQNGHFSDDIYKCLFINENVWISINISLKFVPKSPINNIPALVQIMALRRPGDKPLSEPMMVSLLMHICVTRPQWVKDRLLTSIGGRIDNMQLVKITMLWGRWCWGILCGVK